LVDIFPESPEFPLLDIHTVVNALNKLQLLEKTIDILYQMFDSIILSPRLNLAADRTTAAIIVSGNNIQAIGRNPDLSVQHLFKDLNVVIEYLSTRLPQSISILLSQILLPSLIPRLISTWLSSSVPPSLEGIREFQEILTLVVKLEEDIESAGWTAKGELSDWVERAPRVWLTRRREASLNSVRVILSGGFGKVRSVERVETQTMLRKEEIFNDNGGGDSWNEGWSDEENEKPQAEKVKPSTESEEDVSAWGLDVDVEVEGDPQEVLGPPVTEGDEGDAGDAWDAWGWGDDGNIEPAPSPGGTKETGDVGNGVGRETDREVTLKEAYNITAIPEAILEIIEKVVDDAETLTLPEYVTFP
jgi:protein transport protein DSL1/ZW10